MSASIHREFLKFCDQVLPLIKDEKIDFFKTLIVNHEFYFQKKIKPEKEDKKNEIFSEIRNSFSSGQLIQRQLDVSAQATCTIQNCVTTLHSLIYQEKVHNNSSLSIAICQGFVISKLKSMEHLSMVAFTQKLESEYNIKFSRRYVTFLIKLYRLSQANTKLQTCTLSIFFVFKNFKYFEDYFEFEKEEQLLQISSGIFSSQESNQTSDMTTGLTQQLETQHIQERQTQNE